ncbi:hypothetical protein K456DRAFT_55513 [Colletotrichum gloeosporioides 23]|nr:hypothetical protein K456DRAFT_55513 [Colletotrichum gloeosporioides 23]
MSTRLTLDNIRGVAWATPCPIPWGIFLLAGLLTLVQEEKNDFAYIHAPQIAYYGTYLLPFKFSKSCEPGLRRSILCASRQADRPTLQLRRSLAGLETPGPRICVYLLRVFPIAMAAFQPSGGSSSSSQTLVQIE